MGEPVHCRPPRHQSTLCGLPQASVRTTRKLSLVTCKRCVEALEGLAMEHARRELESISEAAKGFGSVDPWSLV